MKLVTLDSEIKPSPGECFKTAKFRLRFDKSQMHELRGILTVTPGSGGDGRRLIGEWEAFAFANKLAVMGNFFEDIDFKVDEDYIDAKNGTGEALEMALGEFEAEADIPTNLPLFMWGHSAGGEFNYEYACFSPEKVAAFVVNKGGIYYTGLASQKAREVPGLFFIGENDAFYRRVAVMSIYAMGKAAGADKWKLIEEKNISHDIGKSWELSRQFFVNVLNGKV